MAKWQAVFFDLDETLLKNELPAERLFRYHMTDDLAPVADCADEFLQALMQTAGAIWAQMGTFKSVEAALIDAYDRALRHLNLNVDATVLLTRFVSVSAEHTRLNQGALELVQWLRARGIKTGVISNGFHCVQRPKVIQHHLDQWMDAIVFSEQVGVHKPDPEIFHYALQQLSVAPEQSLYVGDHLTNDIEGGRQAGLTVRLYDPEGVQRETVEKSKHIGTVEVINHFDELKSLF